MGRGLLPSQEWIGLIQTIRRLESWRRKKTKGVFPLQGLSVVKDSPVIPVKTGIQVGVVWTPACTGVTKPTANTGESKDPVFPSG